MKALIQSDYGDPAKVLRLQEVPEPEAGPGQVIIALETAVVHSADARTVLGAEAFRKKLPRTPGYEGVGRIHEVGSGVAGFERGMRVFAPLGCGTYRERVAVSAERVTLAPEGDPIQVVLLSLSPATAVLMLEDFVKLEPEDWVIQNAANSAVGRLVIQIAREMRLRVVNVVKSSPVISELKDIGAGAVLLDTADLRDRVLAVTQGAPIKLALDAVAGVAAGNLAACLADDGLIINYGALSAQPCQIPAELLTSRGIRLCGINPTRQLERHTPDERKALYERIGTWLGAKRLQSRVAATYELSQAVEAIRYALSIGDKRLGKVVIKIADLAAPGKAAAAAAATAASAAAAATASAAAPGAVSVADAAAAPAPAPQANGTDPNTQSPPAAAPSAPATAPPSAPAAAPAG